jgi:hypothetical protein
MEKTWTQDKHSRSATLDVSYLEGLPFLFIVVTYLKSSSFLLFDVSYLEGWLFFSLSPIVNYLEGGRIFPIAVS